MELRRRIKSILLFKYGNPNTTLEWRKGKNQPTIEIIFKSGQRTSMAFSIPKPNHYKDLLRDKKGRVTGIKKRVLKPVRKIIEELDASTDPITATKNRYLHMEDVSLVAIRVDRKTGKPLKAEEDVSPEGVRLRQPKGKGKPKFVLKHRDGQSVEFDKIKDHNNPFGGDEVKGLKKSPKKIPVRAQNAFG